MKRVDDAMCEMMRVLVQCVSKAGRPQAPRTSTSCNEPRLIVLMTLESFLSLQPSRKSMVTEQRYWPGSVHSPHISVYPLSGRHGVFNDLMGACTLQYLGKLCMSLITDPVCTSKDVSKDMIMSAALLERARMWLRRLFDISSPVTRILDGHSHSSWRPQKGVESYPAQIG